MRQLTSRITVSVFLALAASTAALAETMKMAVTTSFHNSGLSEVLLPEIAKDTGIEVQLLVVGTGQALKLGMAGDVDAILVHSRAAEEEFIAQGYGPRRTDGHGTTFVKHLLCDLFPKFGCHNLSDIRSHKSVDSRQSC